MAPVAQNRSDACVPAYSPRAAPPCGIPTETPCKSELILAESSGLFLLKISAWLLIWGGWDLNLNTHSPSNILFSLAAELYGFLLTSLELLPSSSLCSGNVGLRAFLMVCFILVLPEEVFVMVTQA